MVYVSIHAPRVGSDGWLFINPVFYYCFNPRPPCGERQKAVIITTRIIHVSIHAPRVGSDPSKNTMEARYDSFNPRPPCGERLWSFPVPGSNILFQSTPPVWGATTLT